ncbi:glutathione peroxidase [Catenovulum agarivorans DS-2]|uniref:Glutathione peroxidase n=1 Tax=Catenovulum agarivorans DS-2 TaxID=1328313 RepID=W7QJW9_9ALTE|nr:glutathione peroxidase [Catenovulum agarivorans]EWH09262.1 glutathione peroxidase [Catenovulum agarivorans DS-2]
MKTLLSLLTSFSLMLSPVALAETSCPDLLQYSAQKLRSKEKIDFCDKFSGKTLLVVNTASKCGFTPQFKQLETLYKKYQNQGLEIVGFPSDNFFQEHDDAEKTAEVCYLNYGVTFTMLETSEVRGSDANPFYKKLIEAADTSPKWNFYKYLIDKNGQFVDVYSSRTEPLDSKLEAKIKQLLQ